MYLKVAPPIPPFNVLPPISGPMPTPASTLCNALENGKTCNKTSLVQVHELDKYMHIH